MSKSRKFKLAIGSDFLAACGAFSANSVFAAWVVVISRLLIGLAARNPAILLLFCSVLPLCRSLFDIVATVTSTAESETASLPAVTALAVARASGRPSVRG